MVKNYRIPKTKYSSLANYREELMILLSGAIFYNKSVPSFQKIDNEELKNYLDKGTKAIQDKYSTFLDKEDYYDFDSLNELEKFLMKTELFSEEKIKQDIETSSKYIPEEIDINSAKFLIGCWLILDKSEVKYAITMEIPISVEKFNNSYE